jgi:adenylate cyclase class 2
MSPSTNETEVKLKITDPGQIRHKLLSLGFLIFIERSFEDNHVYDLPDGSLRQRGCLFRIRDYNGKTVATYKGPATTTFNVKSREEVEAEVSPGENFHGMLERLGMKMSFRYQKYRTEFRRDSGKVGEEEVHVMVDETPIGNYLEIEGSKDGIEATASSLGFSTTDFITDSYLSLYLKHSSEGDKSQMIFK